MFPATTNPTATNAATTHATATSHPDTPVLALWNAVFCLDCETISSSQDGQCAACHGGSLMSLARLLGASLFAHRAGHLQKWHKGLFDVTITVELPQMHAKDLSTTVERLTGVIGPNLASGRASFHVNVKPAADKSDLQPPLSFPERDAA